MPPTDTGSSDQLRFSFDGPRLNWRVGLSGPQKCRPTATVEALGDDTYEVRFAGDPGRYVVDLSGRADGQDASYRFSWTSTRDLATPDVARC